jgi:proteasome accessory factor A
MPTAKVLGIETEYGIAGGPEGDPILASSIIVNAYALDGQTRTNWDFLAERPDRDARGIIDLTAFAPIVETHLANTVLTNGARLYVDHAHPEYSSPECRTPLEAVHYDVAGEEVMRRAMQIANATLPPRDHITLYKNNSDGKGNSYGTHENYLVDRDVPFDDIVQAMLGYFCSRQIVTGAGKVGAETERGLESAPNFQISSRAEFFEEVVGLETTIKRPIMNTRDEPHANAERFRRLHVINGDANMSHTATLVKLGSAALLLAALEEFGVDAFPSAPVHPVRAVRSYALDTSLRVTTDATDGYAYSALDYQYKFLELARRYVDECGGEVVAPSVEVQFILDQWQELLDALSSDHDTASDRIDWLAKLRVVEGIRDRRELDWGDPTLRAIDLQYHDVRREKSLAQRVGLRELVGRDEVETALHDPPASTRAYFRGRCVELFADHLVAANWDSLVFDLGDGLLHRVPMLDPLRGTALLTAELLDSSQSAREMLSRLGEGA